MAIEDYIECEFCGAPVNPKEYGAWKKVTGWTRIRAQGGTNTISMPGPPLAWAHKMCFEDEKMKRRRNSAPPQDSLFEKE